MGSSPKSDPRRQNHETYDRKETRTGFWNATRNHGHQLRDQLLEGAYHSECRGPSRHSRFKPKSALRVSEGPESGTEQGPRDYPFGITARGGKGARSVQFELERPR